MVVAGIVIIELVQLFFHLPLNFVVVLISLGPSRCGMVGSGPVCPTKCRTGLV